MPICPVHYVPLWSAVSWIRGRVVSCWLCVFGSVMSLKVGGLASGLKAAWTRLWGDVTHRAWQSCKLRQSATSLDPAGLCWAATPCMSHTRGIIMPRKMKMSSPICCIEPTPNGVKPAFRSKPALPFCSIQLFGRQVHTSGSLGLFLSRSSPYNQSQQSRIFRCLQTTPRLIFLWCGVCKEWFCLLWRSQKERL